MKMKHQPLQILPPSDTGYVSGEGKGDGGGGGGTQKRLEKEWTVARKRKVKGFSAEEEELPLIKLGLGSCEQEKQPLIKYRDPVLNPAQLFEFQQQSLIFKYMKSGLPVPLQLVIPIWKTVASSFGSDSGRIYKQYPSFVGFSPEEFEYKNIMMDPEPGRCRRTDGKKWRCSKNVVPDQKYCERHMHRGRQRSRKLVEASQIASPSCKTPPSDLKNPKANSTLFQFMSPSSNANTGGCDSNTPASVGSANTIAATATTISSTPSFVTTTEIEKDVSGSKNFVFTITVASGAAAANTGMPKNNPITINSPSTRTSITTSSSSSNNYYSSINGKHDSRNCTSTKNMINISRKSGSSTNSGNNPSAGLGFSPKSVLQVLGCGGRELEPGRCRRTDGKKWRCSREVVPDQKYCGRHMHRGAKKREEASQPVTTTVSVTACRPSAMIISKRADFATLNTNLSISIPARPLVTKDEEKSPTTSSSSDATISDTNHHSL